MMVKCYVLSWTRSWDRTIQVVKEMDQSECINQGFLAKQTQYDIWTVKIEIGSWYFGNHEVLSFYKLLIRIN